MRGERALRGRVRGDGRTAARCRPAAAAWRLVMPVSARKRTRSPRRNWYSAKSNGAAASESSSVPLTPGPQRWRSRPRRRRNGPSARRDRRLLGVQDEVGAGDQRIGEAARPRDLGGEDVARDDERAAGVEDRRARRRARPSSSGQSRVPIARHDAQVGRERPGAARHRKSMIDPRGRAAALVRRERERRPHRRRGAPAGRRRRSSRRGARDPGGELAAIDGPEGAAPRPAAGRGRPGSRSRRRSRSGRERLGRRPRVAGTA